MLKKIKWSDVRLILVFVGIYSLFSFASERNENRRVLDTRIDFIGEDNVYITIDEVNKILHKKLSFQNNLVKDYPVLEELESYLNKNKMIETAEVYKTISGVLVAEIKQREPIGRVIEKNGTYYIDRLGKIMPKSDNHSARVPVVTGEINETSIKDVYLILEKINQDDLLKKSIIGIKIFPSRSIILTDRNFDFEIIFGKVDNIDRKFNNYKAFIQHTIQDTVVQKYKEVNLKFTEQVVCTK